RSTRHCGEDVREGEMRGRGVGADVGGGFERAVAGQAVGIAGGHVGLQDIGVNDAAVVDAVSAAKDGAPGALDIPGEADARTNIVFVTGGVTCELLQAPAVTR